MIQQRRWRSMLGGAVLLVGLACAPTASPGAQRAPAGAPDAAPAAQSAASTASSASSAASNPTLQRLIDAARQEGSLSFAWGGGTLGGTDSLPRLTAGFNKLYGLNIETRFTPGPLMAEFAPRLVQEYQSGRTASTDMFVGYVQHILALVDGDALEAENWAAWAPNLQNPAAVDADGRAVAVQSSLTGITYNTTKLTGDLVPRRLDDLLKPQYKGRVASTPYAASFDNLAVPELWGEQRMTEFTERLADQIAGLIRCNELERIASGEFDAFAIDCSQGNALKLKAGGAPLEFVIAADAPLQLPLYVAVPRNAAHPNAAKLWINYLLSREAQDILYETNFADAAFVPGSRTAPQIQALEASGVKFTIVDIAYYHRNDEKDMARMLAKFQALLRKQR